MVNHVRTLLLNKSYSEIERSGEDCWHVDPAYEELAVTGTLRDALDVLFEGATDVKSRIERIELVMPFVNATEFSSYLNSFDTRSTVDEYSVCTVYDFYKTVSQKHEHFVTDLVNSRYAPLLFQHMGDDEANAAFDSLYEIYSRSFETSKKFSACIFAILFRLNSLYNKFVNRVQA